MIQSAWTWLSSRRKAILWQQVVRWVWGVGLTASQGRQSECDDLSLADDLLWMGMKVFYDLDVSLDDVSPRIWRRLRVPSDAHFAWLHGVLQVSMGWTNSHLYQFKSEKEYIVDLDHGNFDQWEGGPVFKNAAEEFLHRVFSKVGDTCSYEYDFGDGWVHTLRLEAVVEVDDDVVPVAWCEAGERACPPEDSGGIWQYPHLVEVMSKPRSAAYKEMVAWLGGPFDPAAFSSTKVNSALAQLPWPHVTEARLRRVLKARDKVVK
jgi:hypothetical protein